MWDGGFGEILVLAVRRVNKIDRHSMVRMLLAAAAAVTPLRLLLQLHLVHFTWGGTGGGGVLLKLQLLCHVSVPVTGGVVK